MHEWKQLIEEKTKSAGSAKGRAVEMRGTDGGFDMNDTEQYLMILSSTDSQETDVRTLRKSCDADGFVKRS